MRKDYLSMAFSPLQAPVYGGDILTIQVEPSQLNQTDARYFVLFEGTRRRHVVSAHQPTPSDNCLVTYIPGHDLAEEVQITLFQLPEDSNSYSSLVQTYFRYEYDSTFYLTKFLISSVYNDHALDNLELIKSDRFDLSNEVLSTLDTRLSRSLRNANLGTTWHLLGGDSINDAHCEERETLLHFCARLGLQQVCQYLLEQPGREDAMWLPNRQGELPHTIARHNGFHELAEMLSGYNTQGLLGSEQDAIELDNAVLRNYGNGTASLTTFLDTPTLERSVENEINFLKETEEMMKVQRGILPQRNFDSDWPGSLNLQQTGASRSLPSLSLDYKMMESLDRLLTQQMTHRDHINAFLRTSSLPVSDGAHTSSPGSFDDGGGPDGGVDNFRSEIQQTNHPAHSTSLRPDISLTNSLHSYGVLEGCLSGVRDLAESLFQLRDYQLHYRLSREVRKRHFSRFSSSCPSLTEPVHCVGLSPIEEGADHHKSMHDLVNELGRHSPTHLQVSAPTGQQGSFTASPDSQTLYQDGSFDQGSIRICVNGVTVDSSEDFPASSSSPSQNSKDTGGPPHKKYSRLVDGTDQTDAAAVSRGTWSYDRTGMRSSLPLDRRDQQTRVRMLAMTGKSLSLTSLDGEEESEEEDFLDQGREDRPRPVVLPRLTHSFSGGRDSDARSDSPVDSSGSSPGREVPVPEVMLQQTKVGGDLSMSSYNAKSLTDLTLAGDSSKPQRSDLILHGSPGGPVLMNHHAYDDSKGLTVSHSNMTKSLSTPSIPQATEASESRSLGLRERRENKHQEDAQFYAHKYLEDYDAQFRRQKEIEEEEEEENAALAEKKGEISLKDFLSEENSPNDSDEKSNKGFKKEERKWKPSVFSRFQSSYRTKKNKDKDGKQKDRHHFVAISFSNATACDVCHKPMANKAALRCENCLVNVHEHNCKDQVTHCDKNRNKVLQRDGSTHGALGPSQSVHGTLLERQSASVAGTSLRPSQSFKDKRSVSAPVKTQPGQLSAPPQLSHRHSLPTSSLFGSPPNNVLTSFQWPSVVGRFSVLDKAISEESETDSANMTAADIVGQSNMTDTISESLESLESVVPSEISVLDDEPDLQLAIEEPEAWSITVDRKTLKKLNTKDIKRQDTIWELINTEKQYVKRLKIMQKIFAHTMVQDMSFSEDQVDRLFPRLDDLVELHANFLRNLLNRQAKNEDRSVDDIGDVLVDQFQGSTADKMKSVYGVFCSKHTEAMQLYKELVKMDRKFQNFAKKCTNLPVCEKRDISDFILGVTVRLSKYPILIEAILKSTKDKKDRENLSHALLMSKDVVQHVDEKVAAYEKLMDIQARLDSRAVMYKGKKFKRQDLNAGTRELVHTGKIGWKSARGRVYDVLAVVLTDLIVFLQKSEQKYTFLMQDNKSCVIPLHNLLVREKRDAKDSLGIYMISQNRTTPEMYELVCQSKMEREDWIRILQEAVRACPPDLEPELWPATNPIMTLSNEEEKRRKDEHSNQVKLIIEQLHQKDEAIKECCDEKNKLMLELLELSTPRNDTGSRPNSQELVNLSESVDIVHAAMQEASRLTTILQGSGTQLSRSVSSVVSSMKQRFANAGPDEDEGRPPSMLSLDQQEGECSYPETSDMAPAAKEVTTLEPKTVGGNVQSYPSPLQHGTNAHLWEEQAGSDRSSDRGSLGELSAASVSSLIPSPSNYEQMTSIFHLVQYLNTLMNLTSKQSTKVESLRAELAEAKDEIAKLSADMQGRRSVYRHDQLEELRNLQENISQERQEWERVKQQDRVRLDREREHLDHEWKKVEKEKIDLRIRKEDLKREREVLQRQIDMMREQGYQVSSPFNDQVSDELDPNRTSDKPQQQRAPSHRRSASADFYNTVAVSDVENMQGLPTETKGFTRQPRLSVGNLQGQGSNPVVPTKQLPLPVHLLSARNEQRMGGVNLQCLPLKLSGVNASAPTSNQSQQPSSTAPSVGHITGTQNPYPVRGGSGGISRVQSMSGGSRPSLAQQENRHSAPSNLARVMKLADPKGKSSSAGGNTVPPSHKPPAPQPGAPGGPVPKPEGNQEGILYI